MDMVNTRSTVNDCTTYKTATAILGGSIPIGKTNEYITRAQAIALGADATKLAKYKSDKELVALSDIVKSGGTLPNQLMFMCEPKNHIYDGNKDLLYDDLILVQGEVFHLIVDSTVGGFSLVCNRNVTYVHNADSNIFVEIGDKDFQAAYTNIDYNYTFDIIVSIEGQNYCVINVTLEPIEFMG